MVLPGLVEFTAMFEVWLRNLTLFWEFISMPLQELIVVEPFLGAGALTGPLMNFILQNTVFGDMTILSIILGGGLIFYVGYQFFIWLLNLVT